MEVYNYAASCIHHVHAKYTILPVNTAETSLAEESKDGYISKLWIPQKILGEAKPSYVAQYHYFDPFSSTSLVLRSMKS